MPALFSFVTVRLTVPQFLLKYPSVGRYPFRYQDNIMCNPSVLFEYDNWLAFHCNSQSPLVMLLNLFSVLYGPFCVCFKKPLGRVVTLVNRPRIISYVCFGNDAFCYALFTTALHRTLAMNALWFFMNFSVLTLFIRFFGPVTLFVQTSCNLLISCFLIS